jgi:small subunit ribosomal protein S8e
MAFPTILTWASIGTNTLTKSAIVQVDAAPFRQWYEAHYGLAIGKRRGQKAQEAAAAAATLKSKSVERKLAVRQVNAKVESSLESQFAAGRLLACVSSRPGQSGRVDGYILEGEELNFYQRQLKK